MAVSEKSITDKIETTSILEEIQKERENEDIVFNTKFSHKEDLDNLLKLAEELKEKIDNTEITINEIRKKFLVLFAISLVVGITYILFLNEIKNYLIHGLNDTIIYTLNTFILLLVFLVPIYYTFQRINYFRKKSHPDRVALVEVLQLLRETSNIIAEQEDWSVLSRAEFRIRLSRFNLEEKSPFNLFS